MKFIFQGCQKKHVRVAISQKVSVRISGYVPQGRLLQACVNSPALANHAPAHGVVILTAPPLMMVESPVAPTAAAMVVPASATTWIQGVSSHGNSPGCAVSCVVI